MPMPNRSHAARGIRIACAAMGLLGLLAGPARAQETPGVQFYISPYLWVAGISGDVTTRRGVTRDVSVSFGDVLSNLSVIPFMGAAEVRYGRFGLLADVMYLSLKSDVSTRGVLFGNGTGSVSSFTGTFLANYRVVDSGPHRLDLMAGVRPWDMWVKLSLNSALLPGRTFKASAGWVDPIIALRYSLRLGDSWGLTFYGDIGGFGAGSEFTWQVLGTVDYRVRDWLVLRAGYRHLAVNQSRRSLEFDGAISGPIIGATIRF